LTVVIWRGAEGIYDKRVSGGSDVAARGVSPVQGPAVARWNLDTVEEGLREQRGVGGERCVVLFALSIKGEEDLLVVVVGLVADPKRVATGGFGGSLAES
jgi:hypothetical protein